jgi:hypothetical protein
MDHEIWWHMSWILPDRNSTASNVAWFDPVALETSTAIQVVWKGQIFMAVRPLLSLARNFELINFSDGPWSYNRDKANIGHLFLHS